MRNIKKAIEEHKQKVLEYYSEYQILGIFVYGSQNYGLATQNSDIDTKAVIIPTIEDLALHPVKTKTLIFDNGEHCEIMDIMHLVANYKKQNINFIETLFTSYYWVNPLYEEIWNKYFIAYREDIALYNPQYTLKSICGQAIYTLKQDKLNGKKVGNGIRLQYFLIKYFDKNTINYLDCIQPTEDIKNEILIIKNRQLRFEDKANELISWFEEISKLQVKNNDKNKDNIDYIMNKGIMNLIRCCDSLISFE